MHNHLGFIRLPKTGIIRPILTSIALLFFLFSAAHSSAETNPGSVPEKVGVTQKLNVQIDGETAFRSDDGTTIKLSSLFSGDIPLILTPVYYRCPQLCSTTLNSLSTTLKGLGLELGKDYRIVSYSINPAEGPELAVEKKKSYLASINRSDAGSGWLFLTGDQAAIAKLSDQVGFRFQPDEEEFSHSPAVIILTPKGQVSRYFLDIIFDPLEMRRALVEASSGKIGNIVDQVFLYCFRYDHLKGRYSPAIMNLTRVVSAAVVIGLGLMLWRTRRA
jgi:protein SCO1/2